MTDLAKGAAGDSFSPTHILAGDIPPKTEQATLVTGQNLAQFAVVGRVAASGKLKVWDPAANDGSQKAIGVLLYATDATAADKNVNFYVAGSFNRSLLGWNGATAAQKAAAFDGTPIQTRDLLQG